MLGYCDIWGGNRAYHWIGHPSDPNTPESKVAVKGRRLKMKFATRPVIVAVALVVAIAGAYGWLNRQHAENQAIVLYGNVDIREVEMAFRQPGRLKTMHFDEGDTIQPGAVLAALDAQPYQDALALAEAETLQAKVELGKLRQGNRVQEIAQAEQTVRQAEAALKFSVSEFKRLQALVASGAITQSSFDLARSARDQAAAELASAQQALALKKEGSRREDIAAAEARLAGAQAALAQAKTALADTQLVSPANAIVLTRVREPGSMVNATAPVYVLSLHDPVYVRAYVSERQLGQVVPGAKVTVRSDSSTKTYQGHIGFVSPRAEFTPKSVETTDLRTDLVYRLRIVVADADNGLRQGMPVTVQIGSGAHAE
jgi:HlyD family secretion protein